jgi:ubiquinone/menaquinone biosynthesis C-methylase UbiE
MPAITPKGGCTNWQNSRPLFENLLIIWGSWKQHPYPLKALCRTKIKERLFIMLNNGFDHLDEIIKAYRRTNVLFSAYQLGVLDKLSSQAIDSQILAGEIKISHKGLLRLLSALCAMGIILKKNNRYMVSNEYKKYLDPNSANYIGGLIKHEIHLQNRWMQLSESVKTGNPIKNIHEQVNPQDTNRFINAMANIGQRSAPIMLEKIRFSGNEHLLDLGGGPGKYMEKFCSRYPDMHVTLFDQPETISAAKKLLLKHKKFKNIHFIEGNFFEDNLGRNYDVIFSSNVIHIFGANELQIIFNKCYDALKSSGRLLIKDYFLNNDYTGPEFSSLFSIHMLLSTEEGKCYSEEEMITLIEKSHFKYGQTIDLTESSKIIEGIK